MKEVLFGIAIIFVSLLTNVNGKYIVIAYYLHCFVLTQKITLRKYLITGDSLKSSSLSATMSMKASESFIPIFFWDPVNKTNATKFEEKHSVTSWSILRLGPPPEYETSEPYKKHSNHPALSLAILVRNPHHNKVAQSKAILANTPILRKHSIAAATTVPTRATTATVEPAGAAATNTTPTVKAVEKHKLHNKKKSKKHHKKSKKLDKKHKNKPKKLIASSSNNEQVSASNQKSHQHKKNLKHKHKQEKKHKIKAQVSSSVSSSVVNQTPKPKHKKNLNHHKKDHKHKHTNKSLIKSSSSSPSSVIKKTEKPKHKKLNHHKKDHKLMKKNKKAKQSSIAKSSSTNIPTKTTKHKKPHHNKKHNKQLKKPAHAHINKPQVSVAQSSTSQQVKSKTSKRKEHKNLNHHKKMKKPMHKHKNKMHKTVASSSTNEQVKTTHHKHVHKKKKIFKKHQTKKPPISVVNYSSSTEMDQKSLGKPVPHDHKKKKLIQNGKGKQKPSHHPKRKNKPAHQRKGKRKQMNKKHKAKIHAVKSSVSSNIQHKKKHKKKHTTKIEKKTSSSSSSAEVTSISSKPQQEKDHKTISTHKKPKFSNFFSFKNEPVVKTTRTSSSSLSATKDFSNSDNVANMPIHKHLTRPIQKKINFGNSRTLSTIMHPQLEHEKQTMSSVTSVATPVKKRKAASHEIMILKSGNISALIQSHLPKSKREIISKSKNNMDMLRLRPIQSQKPLMEMNAPPHMPITITTITPPSLALPRLNLGTCASVQKLSNGQHQITR